MTPRACIAPVAPVGNSGQARIVNRNLHAIAGRATLWLEIEDLLRHFDSGAQPTGIPRVTLELLKSAKQLYGDRVRLCRLSILTGRIAELSYQDVLQSCTAISGSDESKRWHTRAVINIQRLSRYAWRHSRRAFGDALALARPKCDDLIFHEGDVLLSVGASWANAQYGKVISALKRDRGVRFAFLLHDVLPLTHPHYVKKGFVGMFRPWFKAVTIAADAVFTSSRYNLERLMELREKGLMPRRPIAIIPFGARFACMEAPCASSGCDWPPAFVLVVSTIEIRKNHEILFRVWRRMIDKHGANRVPRLVFAGRVGWRVAPFVREMIRARYLDGKIVVASNLSDADLREAYGRCLFTVFPSFCEGWGLPVSESLSAGTFCVCSNATAIPEVGLDFVAYFDPHNEDEALAKIERAIFDEEYLAARRATIRARYRVRSWDDTARALFEGLMIRADQAAVTRQ